MASRQYHLPRNGHERVALEQQYLAEILQGSIEGIAGVLHLWLFDTMGRIDLDHVRDEAVTLAAYRSVLDYIEAARPRLDALQNVEAKKALTSS